MPIGELFLSASLQVLFDKLASPVISELGKLYGVKDELAKLQRTLNRLRAMLHDADQKKVEGELHALWLRELGRAAYDAENVVDEFEFEDLRLKVAIESSPAGSRRSHGARCCGKSSLSAARKLRKLCSCLSPQEVSFRHKMAHKIDGIRRRLDEISKEKKDLDIGGGIPSTYTVGGTSQPESRGSTETGALLGDTEVFGRDEVKDRLMGLLLTAAATDDAHPTSFSVVSIVGMGGLGKTTLAKLLYNTGEAREHFHLRVWLYVSPDFNLKKLTKQILEHLDEPPQYPGLHNNIDSLNVLQQKLSERLKGKRFLLVLDDVWELEESKWREFSAPLTQGGEGSRVLITTRNASVANILKPQKIELGGLSFDDCWSIFKERAFTAANSGRHQALEPIGREIVIWRLKGVPLAATTVGSLLGSESEERKWREVLDNELWELKEGEEAIYAPLKVSYEYLPFHLKQCFTYCSVFPKGTTFDMMELVALWMAQGYLQPQGKKSMEDVGKDYFKVLSNRSLIHYSVNGRYVIHDLLHDLGQRILRHDSYITTLDQLKKIPEDAHSKIHLCVFYQESHAREVEALYEFKSLRTLSFLFYWSPYVEVPYELFRTVKFLRVLHLCGSGLDTLPDSIGSLKHLRYIDLRWTKIACLPDTFCALYNLQTLRLQGCNELRTLPSGMSNLINLHYLEAKHELVSNIINIGNLAHLQYLEVFSVSHENANRIGDLKNMKELRGKICIDNIQRVQTREEAMEAGLRDMRYIESLEMQWADDNGTVSHVESVVEGLEPPPHLKELTVRCYAGINFHSWIGNGSVSNLESLHFLRCTNLSHFPPLAQNLRLLKTLEIDCCLKLKELPHLPTALENLILRESGLVALPNNMHGLTSLHRLVICRIHELNELPLLPVSLEELKIEDVVGLHALPEISCSQVCEISAATSGTDDACHDNESPALRVLEVQGCPHLTTLQEGLLKHHHLRHLRVLSIKDCEELVDWPEGEAFRSTLRSLEEELSIERCPKLKALPPVGGRSDDQLLPPSLKKLVLKGCPGVANKSLFGQIRNFDSGIDTSVEKGYDNLAHCAYEALRQIPAVDQLAIIYLHQGDVDEGWASPPTYFVYVREECWDLESNCSYMGPGVKLVIWGRGGGARRRSSTAGADDVDDEDGVVTRLLQDRDDDDGSEVLRACLGGHPWTSSLRCLYLDGLPDSAFVGIQQHMCWRSSTNLHGGPAGAEDKAGQAPVLGGTKIRREQKKQANVIKERVDEDTTAPLHRQPLISPLSSLRTISLVRCGELGRRPVKMFLSQLTGLKAMIIRDCPELTLPSLEAGIRAVPSLQILWLKGCPKPPLTPPPRSPSPSSDRPLTTEDQDATFSVPASPPPRLPPASTSPPLPMLRYLLTDDVRLLTSLRDHMSSGSGAGTGGHTFRDHLLASLRSLGIAGCSELTALTAEEEEGLRTFAPSLHCLKFEDCPNLRDLPADLRGILPNLKVLMIRNCPGVRCLRLPASLEFLLISECPELAERCLRGTRHGDDRRHEMAHVTVVEINGEIVQGSYSKYLELKANWDFELL